MRVWGALLWSYHVNHTHMDDTTHKQPPPQLYDGAIYLHQGESYLVTDVDLTQRIATLKRQDVTYYTQV